MTLSPAVTANLHNFLVLCFLSGGFLFLVLVGLSLGTFTFLALADVHPANFNIAPTNKVHNQEIVEIDSHSRTQCHVTNSKDIDRF